MAQLLAEASLEVSATSRVIDDTPTRVELIQYERRFTELYAQISWKLEETKKYYDIYNTLESTHNFMQKEVKVLNSISDIFHQAMSDDALKNEFLLQFNKIIEGVQGNCKNQESILASRIKRVEELKSTHQKLVDEQRKYIKAISDFQQECDKNEWLLNKLKEK